VRMTILTVSVGETLDDFGAANVSKGAPTKINEKVANPSSLSREGMAMILPERRQSRA